MPPKNNRKGKKGGAPKPAADATVVTTTTDSAASSPKNNNNRKQASSPVANNGGSTNGNTPIDQSTENLQQLAGTTNTVDENDTTNNDAPVAAAPQEEEQTPIVEKVEDFLNGSSSKNNQQEEGVAAHEESVVVQEAPESPKKNDEAAASSSSPTTSPVVEKVADFLGASSSSRSAEPAAAAASVTPSRKNNTDASTPTPSKKLPVVDVSNNVVAAPKKPIVFKIGKPTVEGEVIPHFANGAVFRIVNVPERKWSFYNDCQNFEVHIKVTVGPNSKLERLGNTIEEDVEGGGKAYSVVVYPAQTEEFFQGNKDSWKIKIEAKGLSLEYRAKLRAEADEKVQADIKAIESLTNTTDPEERLKVCLKNGLKYVDLEFRPEQNALSRPTDGRQLPDCPWQRPQDYLPDDLKDKVCLFNKIEPNDIDQGALGDCWLLCAIAAVAEFPERIEKMFVHPQSSSKLAGEIKAGAMRVTLNKNGWWTNYITDSYLPVMAGKPSFAKNVEDLSEQWASIVEKVYAKVSGSYACITGGDALQALPDLTGFPVNRFDTEWADAIASKEKSDELFAHLLKYDEANYLINLNTPGVDKSDYNGGGEKVTGSGLDAKYASAGLGMGHAYSVLTVKHFPQQGFELLKIRNPWGGGAEWNGKWGDNDDMWKKYPAVAKACEHGAADDGCFWMDWESVKEYFSGGGVCMVKPTWHDYRVRGAFDGFDANVVLEVTVTKPTKMFCILSQPDKRGHPKNDKSVKYAPAMVSIWRKDAEKEGQYRYHLNSSGDADAPTEAFQFGKSRDRAMMYEFTPEHGPYLVVPRVNKVKRDLQRSYVMGLISESPIDGKNVQVKFKNFPKDCKLFKNFPRMDYAPNTVPEIETEYQYTPQNGAPKNYKGTTLTL